MTKIVILVLLSIAAWSGLSSLERRSLYFPDRTMIAKPSVYRMAYEDLHLLTKDGTRIQGWWISAVRPGGQPAAPTILLCHGNAGNISHRLDKLAKLHGLGANVLIFDYRGFGQSEGQPSEKGTYADAEAAYRWLVNAKALAPGSIVFYGESLGCAVAVEMAIRHPDAAGIILESPFTSTVAMAARVFPWLPAKWIVRYHYDSLSKIPRLRMPLLILHSPQDEIVPFEMGRRLFAAAPEPKQFVELVGGHNEGYDVSGERYLAAVREFLSRISPRPPASGEPR